MVPLLELGPVHWKTPVQFQVRAHTYLSRGFKSLVWGTDGRQPIDASLSRLCFSLSLFPFLSLSKHVRGWELKKEKEKKEIRVPPWPIGLIIHVLISHSLSILIVYLPCSWCRVWCGHVTECGLTEPNICCRRASERKSRFSKKC